MTWVTSAASLRDFLSLVIVYAPDEFPEEDYLEPHEQLNLDSAFAELSHGLDLLARSPTHAALVPELTTLLDSSLAAFRNGQVKEGAQFLFDLQCKAFGGPRAS